MNPFNSNTFGNSLSLRVDGAVGAMSLSPNGRDAVLAGRRGLFIIDLEEPFTAPRWLHHITSWEVADVQWSPHHHAKPSWCISTSNQKALLWDLSRPSDTAILNVAHQHTRAITDINFHPADPELFATCSIDTFILCWDARIPRKATHNWAEWRAGATQVKWNHHNPYEIASSHDHSFYLWDVRYGSLPVLKVDTAHNGKINGMDFESGHLVTCSNDQTVKYWDLSSWNKPNSSTTASKSYQYDDDIDNSGGDGIQINPALVINTPFPVARARPVPFGSIPRCGIMPLRGGDDSIHIIDVNDHLNQYTTSGETQQVQFDPAWSYKGHGGPMKDFLWRRRHERYSGVAESRPSKDYQLVTWSSVDKDLKLWEPQGPREDNNNNNSSSILSSSIQSRTLINSFRPQGDNNSSPNGSSALTNSTFKANDTSISKATETPEPPHNYNSYCSEPPITLSNILSKTHGDILTAMTMHKLAQKHKNLPTLPSQLNHLAWISGVRMGDTTDSPSNLGEEVSFVAHTFPKVRFERISVSTGELIISLRGPPRNAPRSTATIGGTGTDDGGDKDDVTKTTATEPTSTTTELATTGADSTAATKGTSTLATGSTSTATTTPATAAAGSTSTAATTTAATTSATASTAPSSGEGTIPGSGVEETTASSGVDGTTAATSTAATGAAAATTAASSPAGTGTGNVPTSTTGSNIGNNEDDADIEDELIFIRLKITFPKSYPYLEKRGKQSVRFVVEETHDLTASIKQEMERQLSEIASFYVNRHQRFCLEPVVRYLIGDNVVLDDEQLKQTMEVGNEGWADDLVSDSINAASKSSTMYPDSAQDSAQISASASASDSDIQPSSDSEQDMDRDSVSSFDQFSDFMPALNDDELIQSTGSLQNEADAQIEHANIKAARVDSTPLPKGCGALWSRTGQLVCFFIPKPSEDDEALQKFSIFKFSQAEHEHGHGHGDSSSHHDHNQQNNDDSFSESSSDTSESSDSFEWEDLDEGPFRAGLFKTSVGLGNRYVQNGGASTTQKSSVHEKRKRQKGKNIVGIFDFGHLLPDKPALAREYRVLGDSPELLARFNGDVAERHRELEVAAAWRLLEMVLVKDIEVNEVSPVYSAATAQGDSGTAIADNNGDRNESQGLGIRTRPSGHRGSRAVAGPNANTNFNTNTNRNTKLLSNPVLQNIQAMNHLRHINLTGQRLPTYRFYWGSHPYGYSWLVKEMIEYFRQKGNLQMVVMISCILYENMGNWADVPIHTPYREQQQLQPQQQKQEQQQQQQNQYQYQYQVNPRHHYQYHHKQQHSTTTIHDIYRGNNSRSSMDRGIHNNGGGNYGTSYVSGNGGSSYHRNASIPMSTPQHHLTSSGPRGTSPVAMSTRGMSPAATATGSFNAIGTGMSSMTVRPPPSVEVSFQNLDTLDIFEDIYTASLLSSQDESLLRLYRHQYAEMLYSWGLPANRIKILKFNYPNAEHSKYSQHELTYGFRTDQYDEMNRTYVNEASTIDTAVRPAGRFCNFCGLMVVKRVVVCSGCEHIMHSQCASQWWADNEECASGCGCECKKEWYNR